MRFNFYKMFNPKTDSVRCTFRLLGKKSALHNAMGVRKYVVKNTKLVHTSNGTARDPSDSDAHHWTDHF